MNVARSQAGVSLIEAVISVVIVGVMLAAALNVVGAVGAQRVDAVDRRTAHEVAAAMIAELRIVGYGADDYDYALPRVQPVNRSDSDDVDIYNNWSSTPPKERNGDAVHGADRLTREVSVSWYDIATGQPAGTPTNAKIATVRVFRGSRLLSERAIVRTATASALFDAAWPVDPAVIGDEFTLKDVIDLDGEVLGDTLPTVNDVLGGSIK